MYIAGVDEAGRGPLCGPVVAAVVVVDVKDIKRLKSLGVKDSKKLSASLREKLFDDIYSVAYEIKAFCVSNKVIDKINIHNASLYAMKRCVLSLSVKPDILLVDGRFKIPDLYIKQIPVIKGDLKVVVISAASIVAKVIRDKIMCSLHRIYPEYDFKSNKGYPTRYHKEAIKRYGPTPFHRRSFRW